VADLRSYPVWEYVGDEDEDPGIDETYVRPVQNLPVSDLDNRIIGVPVTLANGQSVWGLMSSIEVVHPRQTEQFLQLSIERGGSWFLLARYFEWDVAKRGPQALAAFLALPLDAVFPISYDLRSYVIGQPPHLRGQILAEPRERLSDEERNAMIFS
jgi:hypothetical protein